MSESLNELKCLKGAEFYLLCYTLVIILLEKAFRVDFKIVWMQLPHFLRLTLPILFSSHSHSYSPVFACVPRAFSSPNQSCL